jgi:hypothetical protein
VTARYKLLLADLMQFAGPAELRAAELKQKRRWELETRQNRQANDT